VSFHRLFLLIYGLFLWLDSECTVIAQPIILEVNSEYLNSSFIMINHLIKKIIVQTILSNELAENPLQVRQLCRQGSINGNSYFLATLLIK
jgi:hypothetical protein